jgi:Uma2 family endonuclease
MATATVAKKAPPSVVPYRMTADDYYRMVDQDIIPHDRRVVLWDGILYEKIGKNLPHSISTSKLVTVFARALPPGWCVWPENPLTIGIDKVPLPDLAVVRGEADDYDKRRPEAADVGLIVEISDTSLKEDEGAKLIEYARVFIASYWIINLRAHRVDVHAEPRVRRGVPSYRVSTPYKPDDQIPLVLDGRQVATILARELLPRQPKR